MTAVRPSLNLTVRAVFEAGQEPIYAILDGAREEVIHPETVTSGNPYMLLFKGKLGPELEAACPRLVDLRGGDAFGEWMLEHGWGRSWGVFLRSAASMKELRKHFRTFLKVKVEGGGTMYFRYYDPRVLRLYLPTCTREELAHVFGPVSQYLCEAKDPHQLHRFSRDEAGDLVHEVLRLDGSEAPAPRAAPAPEPAPRTEATPESEPAPPEAAAPLPPPSDLVGELRSMRDELRAQEQGSDADAQAAAAAEALARLQRLRDRLAASDDEAYTPIRDALERTVKRLEFRKDPNLRSVRSGLNTLLVTLKAY